MRIYRSTFGAALAVSILASACSDAGTGTGTVSNAPVRVDVITAPAPVGAAGSVAGSFTVKVVNASGTGVPGILVTFAATGAATVSPASVNTDASGSATTQVTLSTITGAGSIRATAAGVTVAATSAVSVISGPTTKIVNNPKTLRFFAVGDTARIAAAAQDQFGNAGSGTVAYSVVDATLVSVDQAGLVRVLRQPGSTLVIASSSGRADTTVVTVLAAGSSNCTGSATVTPMNVGDVQTFSGTQFACLNGATSGAEFALVAFNSSADPTALSTSVTGTGLATPPITSVIATSGSSALRSLASIATQPTEPQLDESFHLRLLDQMRSRNTSATRAALRPTALRSISGNGTSVSYSAIPATAKVGDFVNLNVSSDGCTGPINHGLRVEAVGTQSIVLSDTLNPAGGFTNADYQRFAARFDTLVYPVDVNAFGAPSDIDKNGKVAILFTRTVNDLTPANVKYFVGGFFNPRDLYAKTSAAGACPASNEGEMFYMLAPDPSGTINGNKRATGFVDSLTTGVIAHEFQHLINGSRRLYVNSAPDEETWLNEGLSHIAEELLYYRESGFAPRMNLTDKAVRLDNRALYPFFKMDAASNIARFIPYLRSSSAFTPYAGNGDDEIETRGATWSFLRYLADRLGPTDGTIWQRFDNSTLTGLALVQQVIGSAPAPYFRDWAVANYLDDLGINSDPRFMHPSWNFRDITTITFTDNPTYPLATSTLVDGTKKDLQIRGGSASYLRFSLPAGKEGLLAFTSGGGAPSTPLQFVVVRTK